MYARVDKKSQYHNKYNGNKINRKPAKDRQKQLTKHAKMSSP